MSNFAVEKEGKNLYFSPNYYAGILRKPTDVQPARLALAVAAVGGGGSIHGKLLQLSSRNRKIESHWTRESSHLQRVRKRKERKVYKHFQMRAKNKCSAQKKIHFSYKAVINEREQAGEGEGSGGRTCRNAAVAG